MNHYVKYFHEKLALLNACDIEGENSVSCLIGGLDNYIVKTSAKSSHYRTPEELFYYLSQINEEVSGSQVRHGQKFHSRKRFAQSEITRVRPNDKEVTCFKCGKKGHYANKCQFGTASKENMKHQPEASTSFKKHDNMKTVALLETSEDGLTNQKYLS